MAKENIHAFNQLLHHWEARDFDVLVVRDGSRFARTQALHARVVEQTIHVGAKIYSLADGLIDATNYRMWISMGGYAAAGEIDNLVKRRQMGYDARARRGLPVNSYVASSHNLIRNEKSGKAERIIVNEKMRAEWEHLAQLVLEGLAWREIERLMYERYGYSNPLGEPYQHHHYYRILHTPSFWGHIARHFKHSWQKGPWVFEPGHDIPEGVTIYYGTHEPVYTGELAEQVKAELMRRWFAIKGKAKPASTSRFTGLFLCAECGYAMTYSRTPGYVALRCMTRYEKSGTRGPCPAKKYLSEKKAQAYIDQRLREMLAVGDPSAFLAGLIQKSGPSASKRAAKVEKEILSLEQQIRAMIRKQAAADETVSDLYDAEIATATNQLRGLKVHLKELQREASKEANSERQMRAYDEIAQLSVDGFWQLEDRRVHQILHTLMAGRRFVVQERKVIGTGMLQSARNATEPTLSG
jgi:hypothetical protein